MESIRRKNRAKNALAISWTLNKLALVGLAIYLAYQGIDWFSYVLALFLFWLYHLISYAEGVFAAMLGEIEDGSAFTSRN